MSIWHAHLCPPFVLAAGLTACLGACDQNRQPAASSVTTPPEAAQSATPPPTTPAAVEAAPTVATDAPQAAAPTKNADKPIAVGDKAAEFTLPDQNQEQVASSELLARGALVVVFYRGDW